MTEGSLMALLLLPMATGVINVCLEEFVTSTFGEQAWLEILAESGVQIPWVTTCAYADEVTYK
jgi:hypothetical protein